MAFLAVYPMRHLSGGERRLSKAVAAPLLCARTGQSHVSVASPRASSSWPGRPKAGVPAIHDCSAVAEDVDARDKPGHDAENGQRSRSYARERTGLEAPKVALMPSNSKNEPKFPQ